MNDNFKGATAPTFFGEIEMTQFINNDEFPDFIKDKFEQGLTVAANKLGIDPSELDGDFYAPAYKYYPEGLDDARRALEKLMPWEGAVKDPKTNKWLEAVRRLNVMSNVLPNGHQGNSTEFRRWSGLKKTDLAEMGVIANRFYKNGKHEYETRPRKLNKATATGVPSATFFQRLYKVAILKAWKEQKIALAVNGDLEKLK